jgi:catechol 2,3-dioxygenase
MAVAHLAPIHIGTVGIIVRDIDRLVSYYCNLLGLSVQERTDEYAKLGAGGVTLLELNHNPDAMPDDPREAGLYHTAFLMPTRTDLARWILHVAKARIPISGASDHDVSEAIYLDDPEGNGVEVYSDRPSESWRRNDKEIFQKTDPLDVEAIIREVDPATAPQYLEAPRGLQVGHIHLRVGNTSEAERFYCDVIGFDVTRRRTGATFVSSGGYHHHVGANVWHSNGANKRDSNRAGLGWFSLEFIGEDAKDAFKRRFEEAGNPVTLVGGGFQVEDPWGTKIRFGLVT